jgi:hypothetical protein
MSQGAVDRTHEAIRQFYRLPAPTTLVTWPESADVVRRLHELGPAFLGWRIGYPVGSVSPSAGLYRCRGLTGRASIALRDTRGSQSSVDAVTSVIAAKLNSRQLAGYKNAMTVSYRPR